MNSKPRGLGMGLTLVKPALERMGGKIEITSSPGCTRARMRLARADTTSEGNPWRMQS
jgi:signal transduction histidine kinase